ncbi:MAG: hypothetical protein MUE44_34200 [Oscillatoriaceae cyanobacterium Prado104]|jgi:hypothetical protein|nr:hypothetical protein [Oscillatoriaceae cyanobacterium Prado104]
MSYSQFYSQFTIAQIKSEFGISLRELFGIYAGTPEAECSQFLSKTLEASND